MKTVITTLTVIALYGVSLIANLESEVSGEEIQSVLTRSNASPVSVVQEATDSVIEAPGFEANSAPVQVAPLPSVQQPFIGDEPLVVEEQFNFKPFAEPTYAPAICATCCRQACCCRPAPDVPTVFCLTDPCGCQHEACVEVPACCAGEQPSISWQGRLFGRQVVTLCWSCCDHEVKVVVKRCGKVKVRD